MCVHTPFWFVLIPLTACLKIHVGDIARWKMEHIHIIITSEQEVYIVILTQVW